MNPAGISAVDMAQQKTTSPSSLEATIDLPIIELGPSRFCKNYTGAVVELAPVTIATLGGLPISGSWLGLRLPKTSVS